MGTIHKYATPHAIETVLSTELDGCANVTAVISGIIDNTSPNLYKFADFEMYVRPSDQNSSYHSISLLESEDGTNYEDGVVDHYVFAGENIYPLVAPLLGVAIVSLTGTGANVRRIIRHVHLPPTKFKILYFNFCGYAVSTGSAIKMIRYNEQDL
jgi:hypothetical protein